MNKKMNKKLKLMGVMLFVLFISASAHAIGISFSSTSGGTLEDAILIASTGGNAPRDAVVLGDIDLSLTEHVYNVAVNAGMTHWWLIGHQSGNVVYSSNVNLLGVDMCSVEPYNLPLACLTWNIPANLNGYVNGTGFSLDWWAQTVSNHSSHITADGSSSSLWRFASPGHLAGRVAVSLHNNIPPIPSITSPANGSTLSGATQTFNWTANGTAVSAWYLWAGPCNSAAFGGCGDDYYNSGQLGSATLSRTVTGLPTNGSTVYVRLWYNSGGWQSVLFQYTAFSSGGGTPAITSPAPGTPGLLPCGTFTFTWTSNGLPVMKWWLWAGDTGVGSNNLYNYPSSTTSSNPIIGMPEDGRDIYVRLWWSFKSNPSWPADWLYKNYAYTAASGCGTTCAGKSFVAAMVCPIGAADGPTCDKVPVGAFCEGDGECGTNVYLDNCTSGSFLGDWYFRTQ